MAIELVPVDELYDIEKKGREIATYYRDRGDLEAYGKVGYWAQTLAASLYDLRKIFKYLEPDIERELMQFINELRRNAYFIVDASYACPKDRVKIGECRVSHHLEETDIDTRFRESIGKKYGGDRCTWLLGVKKPYTLPAAINDVTSCYHRLIDVYARHKLDKIPKTDSSYKTVDASDEAVELCSTWDKSINTLNRNGAVDDTDYEYTSCIALKDRAELRVGSAAGHKTHVDIENGRVRYYDRDVIVNEVMKKLFEEQGLKCSIPAPWKGEPGVECTGLRKDNIRDVAKVISAATSMDLRIGDVERHQKPETPFEPIYIRLNYWKNAINEEYYKNPEKSRRIINCIEEAPENPEFYPSYGADAEYCAIKVKLDLE